MNFFFDYFYYRIYKAYFKYDGSAAFRAIIFISGTQMMLIAEIIQLIAKQFFNQEEMSRNSKPISYLIVFGVGVILMIYNSRKYKGKFEEFDNYWRHEEKATKIWKGSLIIISLFAPWILFYMLNKY